MAPHPPQLREEAARLHFVAPLPVSTSIKNLFCSSNQQLRCPLALALRIFFVPATNKRIFFVPATNNSLLSYDSDPAYALAGFLPVEQVQTQHGARGGGALEYQTYCTTEVGLRINLNALCRKAQEHIGAA